jgi:hypothetical protein
MMKTPVVLVAAALTIAILLAASLLIATGTRGDNGGAAIGEQRPLHHRNEPVREVRLHPQSISFVRIIHPGVPKAAPGRSTAS